jgi:hypothetical protein
MDPDVLRARREAYVRLLTDGLIAIRAAGYDGDAALCEIEADHIHNLPSLLDEQNVHRHHYYIDAECKGYLANLERRGDAAYRDHRLLLCREPWAVLAKLALAEPKSMS